MTHSCWFLLLSNQSSKSRSSRYTQLDKVRVYAKTYHDNSNGPDRSMIQIRKCWYLEFDSSSLFPRLHSSTILFFESRVANLAQRLLIKDFPVLDFQQTRAVPHCYTAILEWTVAVAVSWLIFVFVVVFVKSFVEISFFCPFPLFFFFGFVT